MRKRMQENVWQTGKLTAASLLFLEPPGEAGLQSLAVRLNLRIKEPRVDGFATKLNEHALTFVLDGWKPSDLSSQRGPAHTQFEFALGVRAHRFKSRESG